MHGAFSPTKSYQHAHKINSHNQTQTDFFYIDLIKAPGGRAVLQCADHGDRQMSQVH